MPIYFFGTFLLAALEQDKIFIKISPKYMAYINVIYINLAIKLFEKVGKINYDIKLIGSKQLAYGFIYSLSPIKL